MDLTSMQMNSPERVGKEFEKCSGQAIYYDHRIKEMKRKKINHKEVKVNTFDYD